MQLHHEVAEWCRIAGLCNKLGCLPNPGGLFQQDPNHIRRLEKVFHAMQVREMELMQKPQGQERADKKAEEIGDESI